MFKKFVSLFLTAVMIICASLSLTSCGSKTPEYEQKELNLMGFYSPYDISEEGLKLYKDVGFNILSMGNVATADWSSDTTYYLGSNLTMETLKACKKADLDVILIYNDWLAERIEGEDFLGDKPFSKNDIYGEYKDIIKGIHIVDEPNIQHISQYSKPSMIEDFKKVYPDALYVANLMPRQFIGNLDYESYDQMMQLYEENFMKPFDKPYISVDVYPYRESKYNTAEIVSNYNIIAKSAKKFGIKPAFILQSGAGGDEKFVDMGEGELRQEINAALAYGADTLQYYCYAVPRIFNADGTTSDMYKYCILNPDNTPSPIYYHLQKIHKEIQSYASVILSYDWDKTIGTSGYEKTSYSVASVEYDQEFKNEKFDNAKYYVSAKSTRDLLISRFESEEYGEAYMFVNFADKDESTTAEIEFKDCESVRIYGKNGFDGTPETVKLENGKLNLNLEYGEGAFVVPVA